MKSIKEYTEVGITNVEVGELKVVEFKFCEVSESSVECQWTSDTVYLFLVDMVYLREQLCCLRMELPPMYFIVLYYNVFVLYFNVLLYCIVNVFLMYF